MRPPASTEERQALMNLVSHKIASDSTRMMSDVFINGFDSSIDFVGDSIQVAVVSRRNSDNYSANESLVRIGKIRLRANRTFTEFCGRTIRRLSSEISQYISDSISGALSLFEESLKDCLVWDMHILIPKDCFKIRWVNSEANPYLPLDAISGFYDIEIAFGAYAESEGDITAYDWGNNCGVEPPVF